MILTASILAGLVAAYLVAAGTVAFLADIGLRQALFYAPFKLIWRVNDRDMRLARQAQAPVIYAVVHQSKIDPALMLALLPEDTLHILDAYSAEAAWLEPYRNLARTIAFKAEQIFVSRRLVRVLKGNGRLAVYIPDAIEPDAKTFRLHRAVAQIAARADASIVPIVVSGARFLPFSKLAPERAPRTTFRKLSVVALEPEKLGGLAEGAELGRTAAANALFDRLAAVRVKAGVGERSLFQAARDAALAFGHSRTIIEDSITGPLTYRELFAGARILGSRFEEFSAPGEAVGLLLPSSNGVALSLIGLLSGGRVAAMINHTAGPANVTAAVRTALIRTVVSSRAFIEKAKLADIVEAIEEGGARLVWLEDLRKTISKLDKLVAVLAWRRPLLRQDPEKPAIILFTSGSEGTPKAVVLSNRNLLANARPVEARLALWPQDKLLNVLPTFHSYGLTGGTILPLLVGVRFFLYPSPLHYKEIPKTAARIKPTILFATDTFLTAYARAADDSDFENLRLVVAGAERVRAETRRIWQERFGADIVEGYGMTETSPVVAVNSHTHGRHGTVGRLMPGMKLQLEAVEGIAEGGKLWVSGPNVMMGYMSADKPGVVVPPKNGWHDSGDIVSVDREGFVEIKGRTKRFAKIAGEMVSLGAIEVVVHSLWPEAHHAVISVPDKRRGERIVLVTTAQEADTNALREASKKAGLAELMVPADIVKTEELPLLGSGKTDYPAARRIAMEMLGLDAAA
jgi:acyl-[acyl-carrier-protein]-phospholipid O-acyltransferase / long-chain-fatty-acid--[acyl-carrier-protein] ligase